MTDYEQRMGIKIMAGIVITVAVIALFIYSQAHNPLGPALLPLEFLAMAVWGWGYPRVVGLNAVKFK